MDIKNILSHCDHTILSPAATIEDVKVALDDAIKYKTATACIPPYYVRFAKEYVGAYLKLCTVVGFPNGYTPSDVKLFEALNSINDGADELDMVINIGQLKAGNYEFVRSEIKRIRAICDKRGKELNKYITLKVIIETCLLTEREKLRACKMVTSGGADYIKTSTGFSSGGATKKRRKIFIDSRWRKRKSKGCGRNIDIRRGSGISRSRLREIGVESSGKAGKGDER